MVELANLDLKIFAVNEDEVPANAQIIDIPAHSIKRLISLINIPHIPRSVMDVIKEKLSEWAGLLKVDYTVKIKWGNIDGSIYLKPTK